MEGLNRNSLLGPLISEGLAYLFTKASATGLNAEAGTFPVGKQDFQVEPAAQPVAANKVPGMGLAFSVALKLPCSCAGVNSVFTLTTCGTTPRNP